MGQNHGFVFQLHFHDRVGQQLYHDCFYCCHGLRHGRVKTHGPSAVTATQCSKCADSE